MRILFDIVHPVDVNFFKKTIAELVQRGVEVKIVFRERGKLATILDFELGAFKPRCFGTHRSGFLAKVAAQLRRDASLLPFLLKNSIDLVVCFGPNSAISSRLLSIPYLSFTDDFEYKTPFYHANWFCTRQVFPDIIPFANRKTFPYHGFKELAYLHPRRFKPDTGALEPYQLQADRYVFIRVVANNSLNYQNKTTLLPGILDFIKKLELLPVLSMECDRDTAGLDGCVVLREPVHDIHSILYHALFAISSGDTVAREACLLGIPAISIGGRKMAVNQYFIDRGGLFCSTDESALLRKMEELNNVQRKAAWRQTILPLILNELDDTSAVILKHIDDLCKA